MTRCGNGLRLSIPTDTAGADHGAVCNAGRTDGNGFVVVAEGRDCFGIAVAAVGTGMGNKTILGTSSFLCFSFKAVAQRIYIGIYIRITADCTCMGSVAHFTVGRFGNDGVVIVAQCSNRIISIAVAADSAAIGSVAVLGASGIYDDSFQSVVAGSGNLFNISIVAGRAAVDNAAIGTAGSVVDNTLVVVSKRSQNLHGSFATTGTLGGNGTIFCAGGIYGDSFQSVVAGSGNLLCVSIVTDRAVIDNTAIGAAGSVFDNTLVVVPQRGQNFHGSFTADGALGGNRTIFCAGGIYGDSLEAMACNGDGDCTQFHTLVGYGTDIGARHSAIKGSIPFDHFTGDGYGIRDYIAILGGLDTEIAQNRRFGCVVSSIDTLHGITDKSYIDVARLEQTYVTSCTGNCKTTDGFAVPNITIVQIPVEVVIIVELVETAGSGADMPVTLIVGSVVHVSTGMIDGLAAILG